MSKNNVVGFQGRESSADPLTELLRTGAQDLICRAVEAELQELLAQHSDCRTADAEQQPLTVRRSPAARSAVRCIALLDGRFGLCMVT